MSETTLGCGTFRWARFPEFRHLPPAHLAGKRPSDKNDENTKLLELIGIPGIETGIRHHDVDLF